MGHCFITKNAKKAPDVESIDDGRTILPSNASALIFVPGVGFSLALHESSKPDRQVEEEEMFLSALMIKASADKEWREELVKSLLSGELLWE